MIGIVIVLAILGVLAAWRLGRAVGYANGYHEGRLHELLTQVTEEGGQKEALAAARAARAARQ